LVVHLGFQKLFPLPWLLNTNDDFLYLKNEFIDVQFGQFSMFLILYHVIYYVPFRNFYFTIRWPKKPKKDYKNTPDTRLGSSSQVGDQKH
jgi:hypothetical protein